MSIFTDQPECIEACFTRLVCGAALEGNLSTPHDLQPFCFPETALVIAGIHEDLQLLAEKPERIMKNAFDTLMNMAWKYLTQAMREGGLGFYLREKSRYDYDGKVVMKFLRPGLEEWLKRLISRALMMSILRPCLDKDHWEGDKWHKHGGRDFFVPRLYSDEEED